MSLSAPDAIDLLLQQAAARPARLAVRSGVSGTSYAELADKVRRYAAAFAVSAAPRVLIALPRGAAAYAAMFAAGLAGGFYTPVNDASPHDKLHRIVRLLEPDIIVAHHALGAVLAQAAPGARCVDPATFDGRLGLLTGRGTRHGTAYVMFTSGSTGDPKGVVVPRSALDRYVQWVHRSGTVGPDDVASQFNNLAFDVSVLDIFGALCAGATLVPIGGRGDRLMPARAVAREGITVWTSVPSAIDLMRAARQLTQANLGRVRLFTLAGEPLSRAHLEWIFAVCPQTIIQNAYGPTEATVTVSQMLMVADGYEHACLGGAVSIGRATPGMGLHLSGGAHPDEGEIVITGPQLADGYWKDPVRTAAAFRTIHADGHELRGYHTGDWAERRNGLLFFRGRMDAQVKIRGYRIELDEVAAAIRACGWPGVCVFKRGGELAALIECPADETLDADRLRVALARFLDAYAIPAQIASVPALPRNENDKVDRARVACLFEALAG